jgi:hypothetical protein
MSQGGPTLADRANVQVALRMRPLQDGEGNTEDMLEFKKSPDGDVVTISDPRNADKAQREFIFDNCMEAATTQEQVFGWVGILF